MEVAESGAGHLRNELVGVRFVTLADVEGNEQLCGSFDGRGGL
jgi:hypothetical protein